MADIFLTQEDKQRVQGLYEEWNEHVDPKKLVPVLYRKNMITMRDKQEIDAKTTSYDKNDYLFDNLLMKAPYDQLEEIYDVLMEGGTASQAHTKIANMLPRRGNQANQGQRLEPFREFGDMTLRRPVQDTNEHSSPRICTNNTTYADRAGRDNVVSMQMNYPAEDLEADVTDVKAYHTERNKWSQPRNSMPQQQPRVRRLGHYGTKQRNCTARGKGLCVIIANFTGDLSGYEKDVTAIANFFEEVLGYDVFGAESHDRGFRNLTREEMMITLKNVQAHLSQSLMASKYDRFFMFIMSHGDEHGIKTCAAGSDIQPEGFENREFVRIHPEEVVSMFTHDKIPQLENYPKCIFIQHCRGCEQVYSAADGHQDQDDVYPDCYKATIGSDILLCYASKLGQLSWVSDDGSWFNQEIIKTFRDHYHNEHIIDLLGEVNNRIAAKIGYGQVDGRCMYVKQLPEVSYSLRRKFYLSIPGHLITVADN